jgi:hypothetical protein
MRFSDAADAAANVLMFRSTKMGQFPIGSGGNLGLTDPGKTSAGYKSYEEYPWEDHSSNFGPKGNRLGEGYSVGTGANVEKNSA